MNVLAFFICKLWYVKELQVERDQLNCFLYIFSVIMSSMICVKNQKKPYQTSLKKVAHHHFKNQYYKK
jgi:hypothetical protein